MNPSYIDSEEKELMERWNEVDLTKLENDTGNIQKLRQAAKAFREKNDTKMNIRISRSELERIKEKAASEGLRYQTFVKSVLHKYITGQLVERS